MTAVIGCERARDMLDAYVDGELAMSEQVVVGAHLRACATCAARVDDLRLISTSLRLGASARPTADDERALAGVQAGALIRIRTERDQAVGVRLREAFADMRLLWPAIGAVGAVAVGVAFALGLLHLVGTGRPESLAAMIHALAQRGVVHAAEADFPAEPAPVRFGAAMVEPRVIDQDEATFDDLPDDVVFALAVLLSREGFISNYELLSAQWDDPNAPRTAGDDDALHDAMSRLRFAPGLAYDGSGVAVEMVMVMAKTTVTHREAPAPAAAASTQPVPLAALPAELEADVEAGDRSGCDCLDDDTPGVPANGAPESRLSRAPSFVRVA